MTYRLICADVMDGLGSLADESVNCVVTSPPYFGLRDYGTAGQIGLEKTPTQYVQRIVDVFGALRRVLRKDGTIWLNIGDSYNNADKWGGGGANTGKHTKSPDGTVPSWIGVRRKWSGMEGIKPKDLIGIPWRVAFGLQADGWYLRADIVWAKGNTMPESVTDRPTKSHEYLFLLTKNERYHYDQDAIREPYVGLNQHDVTGAGYSAPGQTRQAGNRSDSHKGSSFTHGKTGINGQGRVSEAECVDNPLGRNKRSVWTVNTQPFPGSHFAVMPERLVEPCILAGCPEGGTVLDPFAGSGTVGVVALGHGRKFVGIDLNPAYIEMARNRIHNSAPLLNLEVA